jgi:hypothetical protein
MSKELFMDAHDELVAEYLEEHPDASEAEAYEATADGAWDRMCDTLAERADYYRQLHKEGLL